MGFADLILRATDAKNESPQIDEHDHFIVDEYQDFNQAEEDLIDAVTRGSRGVLIVGDDDQVLYDKLKAGKAELVRNLYADKSIANAMLPFCSRCSFHIVSAAEHFITRRGDRERIAKVFLPLQPAKGASPVQIIASATSAGAVAYIESFIKTYSKEIDDRKAKLERGEEGDAFLLILSPSRAMKFFGDDAEWLRSIVARFRSPDTHYSEDYFRILNYYTAAVSPADNFVLRKVLHHQEVDQVEVGKLVQMGIEESIPLSELNESPIAEALQKAEDVRSILDAGMAADEAVEKLKAIVRVDDPGSLASELRERPIGVAAGSGTSSEEDAELDARDTGRTSAVELLTIVGAKGLSADHVIVVGFDDVNMGYVTPSAFYVAMTRARISLHLICSLASGGSRAPSAFLADLPDEHLRYTKAKKTEPRLTPLADRKDFLGYLARTEAARRSDRRTFQAR